MVFGIFGSESNCKFEHTSESPIKEKQNVLLIFELSCPIVSYGSSEHCILTAA